MKFKSIFLCALLGCNSFPLLAEQTDDSVFFQHNSQNTFNAVFGLPVPASRMVQSIEWQVSMEHSNQFAGGTVGEETLVLDGESTLLSFRHKQRLGACWQAEFTLPMIAHNAGVFDSAIDQWHKIFDLPDANRDSTDFDSLTYQYANAQGATHNIESPQSGIGDVQLSIQRALGCFATADSTKAESLIRLGVKLPTGNPGELRGSGATDVFADWQSGIATYFDRWHGAVSVGAMWLGRAQGFPSQKNAALYGSLGTQFELSHRWRLIAQLDAHSAFYNSALRELGDAAVNVSVGVRYLAGRAYSWELSISEDAAIDTTPDIVARLGLSYRPSLVNR